MLAKRKGGEELLEVEDGVREKGRRDVHEGKIGFEKWVEGVGGEVDVSELRCSSSGTLFPLPLSC